MGDTLAVIATRYCRPHNDYLKLLALNRRVLETNNYLMREGDPINIPEDWFPIRTVKFNMRFKGSHGTRF